MLVVPWLFEKHWKKQKNTSLFEECAELGDAIVSAQNSIKATAKPRPQRLAFHGISHGPKSRKTWGQLRATWSSVCPLWRHTCWLLAIWSQNTDTGSKPNRRPSRKFKRETKRSRNAWIRCSARGALSFRWHTVPGSCWVLVQICRSSAWGWPQHSVSLGWQEGSTRTRLGRGK